MAHARIPEIVVFCVVSVFIGALLILCAPPVLAQVPAFLPAVPYGSGGYDPQSVAVGDLNGDGILDIVVSSQCVIGDTCPNGEGYVCISSDYCSHGAIGVLLGNGDGTFRPAVTYETSGYLSFSVKLGDLNGDGHLDVVVVNACGTLPDVDNNCPYGIVDIMFGNGDGTLSEPWSHLLGGWYPVSVALADADGDGTLDVVVADVCGTCSTGDCTCTAGSVEVLLNAGGGVLLGDAIYDSGGQWGRSVALGDVNHNGKVDVLVANDGSVGVLLGNGNGTFQPAVNFGSGGTVGGSDALAVADVNGDGKPDLLVAAAQTCSGCNYAGVVGVLLGDGDGTFQPAVSFASGGFYARSVAVADVNGDAKSDLVVANLGGIWPDTRALGVLLGLGNGTFQSALSLDSGGTFLDSVAVADLNRDGKPDVVVENVDVLLNNTPFCTTAPTVTLAATPSLLWPPNGRMVRVNVSGAITNTDTNCSIKTAAYSVRDEYGKIQPSGRITLDAEGAYSFTVWLQASRISRDPNGRVYRVTVGARNNLGKTSTQSAPVIVPHDLGH